MRAATSPLWWITIAVAAAASIANAACPANIPAFEADIVQVFNGNRGDYKWMFGLTTPTDAAPAGFSPCGEVAYISQYGTNSKSCSSAIPNKVSAEDTANGCLLTYRDAIRQATVELTCDPSASVPRMNGEVTVQQVANEYHYAFKGSYAGACGDAPPTPTTTTVAPTPTPSPTPAPRNCPANIPAFEADIVQVFNGNREDYKWMFGLTTPTDAAPAGYRPCGETSYISQYDMNSKGCVSAIPNKVSAEDTANGCLLTYKDAIRQATVELTCDRSASVPRMNGEVTVRNVANEYHFAFKGSYAGACGGVPPPHCPANIPMFEADIVQVFNGNRENYKWMFGLTTPTNAAPAGYRPCGEVAYISQYDTSFMSKNCASVFINKVSADVVPNGCLLTYKDTVRHATVELTCDPSATVPLMNGEVTVRNVANEYHYAFKGSYAGACGDAPPTPTTTTVTPTPTPTPTPSPLPTNCFDPIPSFEADIVQVFNGHRADYKFMFALTTPTDAAPAGFSPCGEVAYISQYNSTHRSCVSVFTRKISAEDTGKSCRYVFTGNSRRAAIELTCDASARIPKMAGNATVTHDGSVYHYAFMGGYAGACGNMQKPPSLRLK